MDIEGLEEGIWSDEKQWVWKQKGEGLIEREVQNTVKFGGGNIMVWGCMEWSGVGQLAEVEGRMNADQYVDILENHLLPSMQEFEIPVEELIFQQNNDPKHTSKKTSTWFKDNSVTLLDWPAQSLDRSPIEHL